MPHATQQVSPRNAPRLLRRGRKPRPRFQLTKPLRCLHYFPTLRIWF